MSAVFEEWTIGDGTYRPLARGDHFSFAFQMRTKITEIKRGTAQQRLIHQGGGEYTFAGRVLWVYHHKSRILNPPPEESRHTILAVEACGFRFYVEESEWHKFEAGEEIEGMGTLLLDYYGWEESWRKKAGAPPLFFDCEVSRINVVVIPERFVGRTPKSMVSPTSLGPTEYTSEDIVEVQNMEEPVPRRAKGGHPYTPAFYLVEYELGSQPGTEPRYE